ncbi:MULTISPECIES: oxidoreductase [unclassified Streptomyces]|uniref:oxidoreductase n=1 Tax=unclassified Streptomyces TaxID=2593676 RepID=UPI002E19AC10|nr:MULTISPECIES: oxidoreductase [unclassified Streptomyces]
MSTWFITGCSTGLGRALATAVLERGWNAVVTARSVDKVQDIADAHPDTALALALDVTDSAEVTAAVEQAEARFGNVDVLVNNAGHGYRSAVEESDDAEVAALFATNFHGPVAMIKAVLPGMRARREGAIVNVSSIAGQYSAPGSGYYSATKFALEGMSDALRKEVGPLGIKVLVVEPGAFRTDFAGRSLQQSPSAIADYAETAGLRRKENDTTHGHQPGDPARAPQVVFDALTSQDTPFRLLLGSDAVTVIRDELAARTKEVDAWETASRTTDFPA